MCFLMRSKRIVEELGLVVVLLELSRADPLFDTFKLGLESIAKSGTGQVYPHSSLTHSA